MNTQKVGYARVSTTDQNMARQIEAIGEADRLFTDEMSGKDANRPGLAAMLDYVREGDVVRVKSIDRLARSTKDLLAVLEDLEQKGVAVEFLDTPYLNTATKEGKFFITVLAALAELERTTIRERQAEGIALAKARGVYQRAPKLADDAVAEIRRRAEIGVPVSQLARDFGVSRPTIYAVIKRTGMYAEDRE